jgi:alkyl sulfatase BDS1-like metallo-beta-lactamase superfamily hydrolase
MNVDAAQKQFNATAEGQQAMCADASTRSTAFMMAAFLRKRGIPTYDDSMIATANPSLLAAIKDELLDDYNQAVRT